MGAVLRDFRISNFHISYETAPNAMKRKPFIMYSFFQDEMKVASRGRMLRTFTLYSQRVVGVVFQHWGVRYTTSSICALEGSVMDLSCSYTYPSGLRVQEAFWINEDLDTPADLSKTTNYY